MNKDNIVSPKKIVVKEHDGGRKDVKISVNRLDIEDSEEKRLIESKILPKLAESPVLVVVIHKPTNQEAHRVVQLQHVRAYAEKAIEKFFEENDINTASSDEFLIIEHHLSSGQVKLSTL